jgi:hypothetical protein
MLHFVHAGYPFKLFSLLDPHKNVPKVAAEVKADSSCLYDWFTADFVKRHPDLASAEALATLEAVAAIAMVGIPHIEARHASLRRIKNAASTTWSVSLQLLSAYFCVLRARLGQKGPLPMAATVCKTPGPKPKPKVSKWLKWLEEKKGRSKRLRIYLTSGCFHDATSS